MQSLADLLTQHANHTDFEIGAEDRLAVARRELRDWIKRGLVVEREGRLYATDALEEALRFVDALDNRIMTSIPASRLSVVQREIESVEASLNPDPRSRTGHLRRQIKDLEQQLAEVEAGRVEVLSEREGVERIRDIFNLAMSLARISAASKTPGARRTVRFATRLSASRIIQRRDRRQAPGQSRQSARYPGR